MREPMSIQLLKNPDRRQELMEGALASTYVRQMPPNPAGGREARYTDKTRDTTWLKGVPVNQGLCFLYYIDLAVITQEIVNKVYSMDCVLVPWTHIENRIGELRSRIDLWRSNLADAYDFARKADDGPDLLRGKLFLAFHYHSARVTLGRPCLCRRDARQEVANRKETFSHELAVVTLESSLQMLDLVPDAPDAVQLYQICPWWCILHFLMQAATVLLLELSFGSIHMPEDEMKFLGAAKKAIRWLFAMSEFSIASRRAWQLCDSNLRRIARGMSYDISDLPLSTYEPKPAQTTDPTADLPAVQGDGDLPAVPAPPAMASADHASGPSSSSTARDESQFDLSELSALPPLDQLPVSTTAGGSPNAYFPYDPITDEFIRSFFPAANEEYSWDEPAWE